MGNNQDTMAQVGGSGNNQLLLEANAKIQILQNQVNTLQKTIQNYGLSPSQIQSLTALSQSQVNVTELANLKAQVNEQLKQITNLNNQLNAAAASSQYIDVVQKLQIINTDMKLNIQAILNLTITGPSVYDLTSVRVETISKIKTTLLKLYGNDGSLKITLPNEEQALISSSEFFIYYIYSFLNSFYNVYKLFNF